MLVGAGTADQHDDDPARAVEAVELMRRATDAALDDSGRGAALRERIDWIGIPEGTWSYPDPGRLLASALGCREPDALTTVLAGVGILQQDLLTAAASAVVGDEARVAVVVGGEAKYRSWCATRAGEVAPESAQPDGTCPDVAIRPDSLGVSDLEIERNTVTPVAAYAMIENALGHALGRSVDEHRDAVAALWSRFSTVARQNPRAWDRTGYEPAAIREPTADGNRMISFPYTKLHSSQWNVDQAAAVVFCSLETARELGIAEDRHVFPIASVVANDAVPVSERRDIHRCVGAEVAARRVLDLAGIEAGELRHVDLYSCFPAAVEVLAGALGLAVEAPAGAEALTVTGGMSFAGGPLNNYVLQALVELVERLRRDPGSRGMSTSVSGFLVKQGFSIWSTDPPERGARGLDVSQEVARATETVPVTEATGPGTIVTWTVDFAGGQPSRSVAVVDLDRGPRTIASSPDPDVAGALLAGDPIGARVVVGDGGSLRW